jgi:cytochrome oxidase Cu insertion factor (SCO1/SenC/PrrC family)
VGEFSLTERGGKAVTPKDLAGKVWVAGFVFTRCTGPCPQVSGTMGRLQAEFAAEPDFRLVTFTVDPEHDDPKELARYAEKFRADADRWLFLTGKEAEVARVLRDGFKVAAVKVPEAKAGEEVDHSTKLAVVDREGRIRGYFAGVSNPKDPPGTFEENYVRLKETVAGLLKE